jgi:hypothetical protein
MIKRPPYQSPPAPFSPGNIVKFESKQYVILASTHTHCQLEGVAYAVPNWQLKTVRKPKDRVARSKTNKQISV